MCRSRFLTLEVSIRRHFLPDRTLADSMQTVDSLKAVEMRNRVMREMQSDISVFELLSATPLAELAIKIASRSALVKLEES